MEDKTKDQLERQLIENMNDMFSITLECRDIAHKLAQQVESPWVITCWTGLHLSVNYLQRFYHHAGINTEWTGQIDLDPPEDTHDKVMYLQSKLGDLLQIYESNNFNVIIMDRELNPTTNEHLSGFYHSVFEAHSMLSLET